MVVLVQRLPWGLDRPSWFRVLVMSKVLVPCRAIWKMRRATPSAGGPDPAWDVSWPHPAPAPSCSRRGRRWRSRSPARQLPAFPARPPGQDFAIEFVHALDDGLHQLAGGGIVGVLGDGDHPDTPPAEHGLEGDGVFPLAGEAGELPDQDFLKGGLGPACLVQHLAELGPIGDAPAPRLVDELAGH